MLATCQVLGVRQGGLVKSAGTRRSKWVGSYSGCQYLIKLICSLATVAKVAKHPAGGEDDIGEDLVYVGDVARPGGWGPRCRPARRWGVAAMPFIWS